MTPPEGGIPSFRIPRGKKYSRRIQFIVYVLIGFFFLSIAYMAFRSLSPR